MEDMREQVSSATDEAHRRFQQLHNEDRLTLRADLTYMYRYLYYSFGTLQQVRWKYFSKIFIIKIY